ncbi:MAG: hypothetical protein J5746_12570, partial [Victivallales bacterium]|nr:hypothetical protein [Victivallales bacterium]
DDDSGDEDKDFRDKRKVFFRMGVTFPGDAKITYYARLGKLVSYNTPENQLKIERLMQEINQSPTLVSIEAKVVEIEQTNLDTLGFEWSLEAGTKTLGVNSKNKPALFGNYETGSGNTSKFQIGLGKELTSVTSGLRFASEYFGDATEDSLFSVYTVLGNYAFNTVLHAIEQEGINNVLSAPKVTTISGKTASIKVVTQRQFPDEWDEAELETDGDNGSITYKPATPQFDDKQDIGVMLFVTPVVAPDKYSIYLDLEPQVIEFLGYDTSFNTTQIIDGRELEMKNGMTAILSKREVKTKVVVWDGETIVLGGMIKEEHLKFEDKVPLLGHLPVIGHLFTSTGEKSIKTNTLIFVSARLVNPAGIPIRPNDMRGLPDFRH